jgi:glycine dehydrogenase subunit 1
MRYLPHTAADRRDMLAKVGVASIDDLFRDVPAAARLDRPLDLPAHMGEMEVERLFAKLAAKNLSPAAAPCFLGAGAYRHHIPASADHLIQRSEFLTSYTPYQPEISQGTLQYLFEFQTQVAMLTGMEAANASMYDGATSCAEAALMALRLTKRRKVVLSGGLHPHYQAVTATMLSLAGDPPQVAPLDPFDQEDIASLIDGETACVIVQNPDLFGRLHDFSGLAEKAHAAGALLVVAVTEAVSLGAVTPPGEMGADIVVAEGQSLGVPLSFGGPYVGLFATREKFLRQMPGRLCGQTVDQDGRRAFVLTLSAREQHIRREKATSNICTNAGLCALAFCIHVTLLGEAGFTRLAAINHAKAVQLAGRLAGVPGVSVLNQTFFNEFTVRLPKPAAPVVEALAKAGILAGVPLARFWPDNAELADLMLVAATETNTDDDMARLTDALAKALAR